MKRWMYDIREMQKKAWSMKKWMQNVREMQKALINEKMDDIREMQTRDLINLWRM